MNTATAFQTMPTAEVVEQPKETALAVIPEERALEVFLEGKGIDELLAACEEQAKREQEERDRKIAEAAAEKARRDAEEKAAREKAEAERRAADLANRETIHRAIRDALKDKGIPVNYAVDVVSLISTGSIPFVTIEY